MNKKDYLLIGFVLVLSLLGIFMLKEDESINKKAVIYYDNEKVLEIDLSKDEDTYEVMGENGVVKIVAGLGRVKVESESSPLHLCSKQGYISSSYESIVCLPNKIVVKIESIDDIDTIVR